MWRDLLIDKDDREMRFWREGGKGKRKEGRENMREGVLGKDIMKRIERKKMRKGWIGRRKEKSENEREKEEDKFKDESINEY